MPQFIDRRLNPRDKSLGNRCVSFAAPRRQSNRRSTRRSAERTIGDAAQGRFGFDPHRRHHEPQFHLSRTAATATACCPATRSSSPATIDKPKGGGAAAAARRARRGDGEDDFTFALTEEEFLDLLFEDLELPDLVKASLKDAKLAESRRAGYSADGVMPNLNVLRTMRVSMSRRLALRRPTGRGRAARGGARGAARRRSAATRRRGSASSHRAEIERLKRLQRAIPFIDPIDVRYNRFTPRAGAAREGGDVLPDGRLGLDGRAREGSGQALLHPAAPVPEAQIRARRRRLHPPHPRGQRGRRARVLLRPRDRRHGRQLRR